MKPILTLIVFCVFNFQLRAQVSFTLSSSPTVGSGPTWATAADVNGDGKVDLIAANGGGGTVTVLTNNGSGGFVLASTLSGGSYPVSIVAADINGDGKVDLICAKAGSDTLSVFTNDGSGGFVLASSPSVVNWPISVTAADVNGDGKVDLITANYYGGNLSVLTNNGNGGFVTAGTYSVGTYPRQVTTADVNGDGKVDLISGNEGSDTVSVLTNDGSGGFVLASTLTGGRGAGPVTAADVNGDGKVDLICADFNINELRVFTNDGSGGFVLSSILNVGSGPRAVVAADVNGDGKEDLISANWGDNTLTVLTNDGSGGFVLAATPGVGSAPYPVIAADVNGDGKVDLISANSGDNTLSVLINTTPFPLACTPPPAGLVSWWPGEGNANDIVGTNNGLAEGEIDYTNGEVGQAFLFYTANADVKIPASASLNVGVSDGFTIEAWINPSDVVAYGPVFEWNTGTNFPWGVHLYTGAINPVGGPGSLYANVLDDTGGNHYFASPSGTLTANVFQHVALTYDKSTGVATIYCNGVMVAQQTLGSFTPQTSYDLYLGRRPLTLGEAYTFQGLIDEPSLYNRALSASEIQTIYNAGSAGKCPPSAVPPVITSQPQSVTVNANDNASFSVTASSTEPLNFQWSLNGTNIMGATNTSLIITNVAQDDLGAYAVVVANAYGSVTSSNAMLSMYPYLAVPFGGLVTIWGKDATLSVDAWGTGPLSYQWFKDGAAILNGTNSTLLLSSIQFTNAGLYWVVVNSALGSVTNTPEQVVVNPAGVSLGLYPGVTVSGVVGYTYVIQSTTDLSNTNSWVSVATLTLQVPIQLWVDIHANTAAPGNPQKFYRVMPGQ